MKKSVLGEEAQKQLDGRGVSRAAVLSMEQALKSPPSFVHLERACAVGDGIVSMSAPQTRRYCELYESRCAENLTPVAFIPASGTASRMFARLVSGDEKSLENFTENIGRFAFFDDLKAVSAKYRGGIESLAVSNSYGEIADLVLSPEGLGYGDIPKGLVKFHRYGNSSKTAFEEQMDFAGFYARGSDGVCRVHFTVPQRFLSTVENHVRVAAGGREKTEVSLSFQKPETDTVALDVSGNLLADESGGLVFRPAGHGALLDNLSAVCEDMVFICNIDNIAHGNRVSQPPAFAKKALAGLLIETADKIRALLLELEKGDPGHDTICESRSLCMKFGFSPCGENESGENLFSFFKNALDRPLRVCGVVKNTGEPGGGPFWAKDPFGRISPQIVESVQIHPDCAAQKGILKSSTHFNPVDMVCLMKDRNGGRFNLREYGGKTFMITEKMFAGRLVKALELPGLWNGAMSGWNTVFAEIPDSDFNPVKEVFDLLRSSHQDLEK